MKGFKEDLKLMEDFYCIKMLIMINKVILISLKMVIDYLVFFNFICRCVFYLLWGWFY